MKPSSAKQKGRLLQQLVRDKICEIHPELLPEKDVFSRSMGASGEDIMMSPIARAKLPLSIECKNRASFAIYKDYEQSIDNASDFEPVVVIKQNHSKPLVVVDLEYFLWLHK